MSHTLLVLGNQLFSSKFYKLQNPDRAFMCEDLGLCEHFRYHKHKIIFFLSAMRHFCKELEKTGIDVDYHELNPKKEQFFTKLQKHIKDHKVKTVTSCEVEDKFFESQLETFFKKNKIQWKIVTSPMFLTSRDEFEGYLGSVKKPFMKTFYERQRNRLEVMMTEEGPEGGRYSFDAENRLKMPKDEVPPKPKFAKPDAIDQEVMGLVDKHFSNNPGQGEDFWLETTRKGAQKVLKEFLNHKLDKFGDYQDALVSGDSFLYHSLISPYINIGLLTPDDVIDQIVKKFDQGKAPINSVEGFVRQVIGWREFIRGIYQNFSEKMDTTNHWNHKRKLTKHWYEGTTGLPPLDDAIKQAQKYGYCHHIERLMVLANLMNLCEIEPTEVHRWFMEMFVDSSDWVMGPNVYGMGLMSDGGVFATKPYISGSNYILKMSHYKKGEWCDAWDGLYWKFVERNEKFFSSNPRMSMMTRTLARMKPERRRIIYSAADQFLNKVTES